MAAAPELEAPPEETAPERPLPEPLPPSPLELPEHPARLEGEREIARLERLGLSGEVRGDPGEPGERPLPSLDPSQLLGDP